MLDAVKDYLTPKTFGVWAYVWSIVHIVYGMIFTVIVVALKEGEPAKFTCYVALESTLLYKTQVDKACYSRYQQKYNAPLQFYLFVILSAWSPIIVALIYSLRVRRQVERVSSRIKKTQAESEADNQGQITGSSYVFYIYFFHLAIRALFGILFTILQYSVFFPNGFQFEFNCSLEPTQFRFNTAQKVSLNETSVACENPSAPEKHILWVIVSLFNTGFAFIMVLEMIHLCKRFPDCDYTNFIDVYLLRNQNIRTEEELERLNENSEKCIPETAGIPLLDSVESAAANLQDIREESEQAPLNENSEECVPETAGIPLHDIVESACANLQDIRDESEQAPLNENSEECVPETAGIPLHDSVESACANLQDIRDETEQAPLNENSEECIPETAGIPLHDSVESACANLQDIRDETEQAPLNENSEECVPETAGIPLHDSVESACANLQDIRDETEPAPLNENSEECIPENLQESLNSYKKQVLWPRRPRPQPDVFFVPKAGSGNLYTNLVIHSERARHKFPENMKRHEIYDVYMKVPNDSIRLKEVKDLFHPNKDTEDKFPKTILAVGRPGIGKTVLTEKVMRDWAGGVDDYYKKKIAFHFEFRWFNENKQNPVTLKTFLHKVTPSLSEEKFDEIYEYIIEHSEKVILVFDGLDEFNGSFECLEDLPPPNDPNVSMSWISLFIKLISGHFLSEATLLVTSRPTANEFYSRFSFDRTVEIIGFSPEEIKAFVQKLCDHYGKSDLKPAKIWEYIHSTSDILNLCYIPVNCWIVCTTLLDSLLEDSESKSVSLPNTLTELYLEAITCLDEKHFRTSDVQISAEAIKKLQLLAFQGIELGKLVFKKKSFDEQMQKSGLLNKFANPYSQGKQQFCFIHLTIQEFLAAIHVTETFNPEEINEFIASHIKIGKWHLVLQFIAGLLGEKINECFQPRYSDCVVAFAKCFTLKNGELDLTDDISLRVIKCLREVNDEILIKKCNDVAAMNDVKKLSYLLQNVPHATSPLPLPLALSDWEAVAFVCKHMKKLVSLELVVYKIDFGRIVDVSKLLEQRCIKDLRITSSTNSVIINVKGAISALLRPSSCTVEHEHSKVTELHFKLLRLFDDTWSDFLNFFKQGRAHDLEKLVLMSCLLLSRQAPKSLFDVLTNEYCPKLKYLDLSGNFFSSEDFGVLRGQRLFNLTELYLNTCLLPQECVLSICELLTDERCNLTVLSLEGPATIKNEESQDLCEALQNEHCKLNKLNVASNGLTDQCIPNLCKALENEHCKLNWLDLSANELTDQCIPDLCKALENEHCKLDEVILRFNKLTDQCIPHVCKALESNTKLKSLSLARNEGITNEGLRLLCKSSTAEEQQKKKVDLSGCSLSNDCIPYLRDAVKNKHFVLKQLTLAKCLFSEEEQEHLHQLQSNQMKFELI